MSYKLEKPYTDTQRADFIVEYNRKNGLRIEETDKNLFALESNEIIVDGEPVINPDYEREHFEQVRALKLKETETKCTEKRYSQTFTVELQEQECEFDTTEQTQSDLQTAAIVTSSGGTYDNWVTNNGVVLNLTMQDVQTVFAQFFLLVSPLYTKQLEYVQQINACTTAEEVETIVINYGDEPIEEETDEENSEVEEAELTEIEEDLSDQEISDISDNEE